MSALSAASPCPLRHPLRFGSGSTSVNADSLSKRAGAVFGSCLRCERSGMIRECSFARRSPSERLATRTVHLRFMHVNAPVTTTSYRIQFATLKRSEGLMSAAVSRYGTTRNCLRKCNQRLWSSRCAEQSLFGKPAMVVGRSVATPHQ